ncbi:unnamed protein product [[Candida] boidinii]|nr:unnamed protein product [[Candida] boidinii]
MPSTTVLQPEWVKMDINDIGNSIFNEKSLISDYNNKDLKKDTLKLAIKQNNKEIMYQLSQTRDGLINNEFRSKIWPILLGMEPPVSKTKGIKGEKEIEYNDEKEDEEEKEGDNEKEDNDEKEEKQSNLDTNSLPQHKDEDQVKKDVDRSFINYPKNLTKDELESLRLKLNNLIVKVLRNNPKLNYYQGYHDIATIILLVFENDEESAFKFLQHLSLFHLRDHMLPSIESTIDQLHLIYDLIEITDPLMYKLIKFLDPSFSISFIISIFSHNIEKFDEILLVWDFIFSEDSMVLLIYIFASILIYYKFEILNDLNEFLDLDINNNKNNKLNDLIFLEDNKDLIHCAIKNTINNNLNNNKNLDSKSEIFSILQLSLSYLHKYPPIENLKNFNKIISNYSVLKTTSCYIPNILSVNLYEKNSNDLENLSNIFNSQIVENIKLDNFRKLKRLEELKIKQDNYKKNKLISSRSNGKNNTNNKISSNKQFYRKIIKISISIGFISLLLNYLLSNDSFKSNINYYRENNNLVFKLFNISDSINTNFKSLVGLGINSFKK